MASTPHPSALVMFGDLRVALSQSTHTRAWKERIMETIQEKGETGLLTPLFEAQLQYQSDMIASETHTQERSPTPDDLPATRR